MNQLTLDFEQNDNLARVQSRTGLLIVQFFDSIEVGTTFHAQDLRDYVAALVQCAPASPDRILRNLRASGVVRYEVVDRRNSLYKKL